MRWKIFLHHENAKNGQAGTLILDGGELIIHEKYALRRLAGVVNVYAVGDTRRANFSVKGVTKVRQ